MTAGTLGFEPRTEILEISMIPFHHVPLFFTFSFLCEWYVFCTTCKIFLIPTFSRWMFVYPVIYERNNSFFYSLRIVILQMIFLAYYYNLKLLSRWGELNSRLPSYHEGVLPLNYIGFCINFYINFSNSSSIFFWALFWKCFLAGSKISIKDLATALLRSSG